MNDVKKRSEYISDFLDFLSQAKSDYAIAIDGIKTEEKRQEDLLHEIEFCGNAKERSKKATRLNTCRKDRRYYKDIHEETAIIQEYLNDPVNKKAIDKLREVLGSVRKSERYHADRVYRPRLKEVAVK